MGQAPRVAGTFGWAFGLHYAMRAVGRWAMPALLVAVWLLRQGVGELYWWSRIMCELPGVVWGIPLILLILFLVFRRPRPIGWSVRSSSALLALLALLAPTFNLSVSSSSHSEGALKVLTLNMQHGLGSAQGVADLIERERPDVLLLQEAGPLADPKGPPKALAAALSAYAVHRSLFEAVAVRGEILDRGHVDLPEMSDTDPAGIADKKLTWVRARVRGLELIASTVHLSPFHTERGEVDFARLNRMAAVRREQYRRVVSFLASQELPTVLAGDFNGQPFGPGYRSLGKVAIDAFAEVGSGFGYTLPTVFPMKRIDYIWCRSLTPVRCEVVSDRVSDHKAVKAILER